MLGVHSLLTIRSARSAAELMRHVLHLLRRPLRAYAFDIVLDLHRAGMFETQRTLDVLAFVKRLFEADKHDV
jgi:hypothetical protein